MSEQNAFNFDAARESKRSAIKRVNQHANPEWKRQMLEVVRQVCLSNEEFTADLPMEIYAQDETRPKTHTDRAMGAVMVQARKLGYRAPTNEYRESARRSCHNRPLRVWRSLICPKGQTQNSS